MNPRAHRRMSQSNRTRERIESDLAAVRERALVGQWSITPELLESELRVPPARAPRLN